MLQITTIRLAGISNAAHYLFMDKTAERAKENELICKNCADALNILQNAIEKEQECASISQKSFATDEIAKADALRDKVYAGYKKAVQACMSIPLKEYVDATTVLNQHIIDYRINTEDPLDKESGALMGFIQDLETVHKPLIETLHLEVFVEHLRLANDTVEKYANVRTDENAAKIAGAMKQARTDCDNAYRDLIALVHARMLLEGSAAYESFANFMNTQIAHYKQSMVGRRKTKVVEEEED